MLDQISKVIQNFLKQLNKNQIKDQIETCFNHSVYAGS